MVRVIDMSVKDTLQDVKELLGQYLSGEKAEEVFKEITRSLEVRELSRDETCAFLERVTSDIRELIRVSDYVEGGKNE